MMIHLLAIALAAWCTVGLFNMWRRNQLNAARQVPKQVLTMRGVEHLTGEDAARWWRENAIKSFLWMLFMAAVSVWLVVRAVRG